MSRINLGCVVTGLVGVLWFGAFTVHAQRTQRPEPGAAPTGSLPRPSQQEAGAASRSKPLDQLDPHLRLVAVDLLVAEIAAPKGEAAKPGRVEKELDARDLTGPVGEVLTRVEALKRAGRISYVRRIQLSALEDQQAWVDIGEHKPSVTSVNVMAGGRTSKSVTYLNIGTNVQITSRVTADERVLMDIRVEDSHMRRADDAVSLGTDEKNQPIPATEMTRAKLDTRLSLRSGQAVSQVVQTSTREGPEQFFVVVAARIVDPDAKRDPSRP